MSADGFMLCRPTHLPRKHLPATVREYRMVAELRREGLDDTQVAARLGIPRQRAVKLAMLARANGEPMPNRNGRRPNVPVLKQPAPRPEPGTGSFVDDLAGKLRALDGAINTLAPCAPRESAQLRTLRADLLRLVAEVRQQRGVMADLADEATA